MSRIPPEVREKALDRDRHSCARCGKNIEFTARSLHHRQGRGGKAPHVAENLITLCGSGTTGCHGHVHAHPDYSYSTGFMVRRLGLDDPSEVPITNLLGETFILTKDWKRV